MSIICARRRPSISVTAPTYALGRVDRRAARPAPCAAVDLLGDDLRPRDLELVALAAHRLDQDREVQLAAAGDHEDVGRVGRPRRAGRRSSRARAYSRSRSWRRGRRACLRGRRTGEVLTPKVMLAASAPRPRSAAARSGCVRIGHRRRRSSPSAMPVERDDVAGAGLRPPRAAPGPGRSNSQVDLRCARSSPSARIQRDLLARCDACRGGCGRCAIRPR